MRPVLLLDADGPLNPFAAGADAKPPGFVEHLFRLRGWSRRRPLRMWLNPDHEAALLDAAGDAELVWATTWGHQANTVVGPAIGLPNLRVVECGSTGGGWKYDAVARFAWQRPLVWLDDDFDLYPTARDAFPAKRADVPTALVRVDPRTGLTEEHLAEVRRHLA
ncbi:HAD domain-containing protein [Actinosynnema pretiosum]|uniref:Secreted protein n=1 Tax=Actinosynnema pretiosum TaxID=42197 RepID=A0A290Z5Z0_9PSEU|nr:HAD domain-containing protein [Actinosynnema pretiosum]ATE54471.1 hypothetical protein CNX65_15210 [Actinosynnema pretiosum]